jgi:hypothetical protein
LLTVLSEQNGAVAAFLVSFELANVLDVLSTGKLKGAVGMF